MEDQLQTLLNKLQELYRYAETNPEFVNFIYTVLIGIVGALLTPVVPRLLKWLRPSRQAFEPSDIAPFDVILPHSDRVLQTLLGGSHAKSDDPLADFNIPYQRREVDRNTQKELRQAIEEKGWILILGRTGIGKSREAAELAKSFNAEGWTVLKLKGWKWQTLGRSGELPIEQIGSDRKLVFWLDDLNRPLYQDYARRKAEKNKPNALAIPAIQDRLLEMLTDYERECRPEYVRVIATARNEPIPDREGEPAELEKLDLDSFPQFRDRFLLYNLPEPETGALVDLLNEVIPKAGIKTDASEDYARLATRSDRTFRIFVNNLERSRREHSTITQNFTPTLKGDWAKRYRQACKKYKATPYIYAAVNLLRTAGVALYPFTVAPTARLAANRRRSPLIRLQNRWQIDRALKYLIAAEDILNPKDGQIEASQQILELGEYIHPLHELLLTLAKQYLGELFVSLYNFGIFALNQNCYQQSVNVCQQFLLLAAPLEGIINNQQLTSEEAEALIFTLSSAYVYLGTALFNLQRYEEAIASFDKALEFKPNEDTVWTLRGIVLVNRCRYEEAIDSFDKALQLKPANDAWTFRGVALMALQRYAEAIVSFDKALQLKFNDSEAWHFRGIVLGALDRYEEAIASYDKAIKFKPNKDGAWYGRGLDLYRLQRYEEAIVSFDKAIEFKPNYGVIWNNRGLALTNLKRYEEAIESFDKAIELNPNDDLAWHMRGLALANLQRYEEAIASYDKAIEFKPNFYEAWYNRGNALAVLQRYEEAIASFDKSLEFLPDDGGAYYNKARCYALWGKPDEAVVMLQWAIELDADYREKAKTDSDFDGIREDERFQQLINGSA